MSDEEMDFDELIGISQETGSRIMGEIITSVLQAKNPSEHIKLLVQNMNQMERELFLKGFLFAMFFQNLGEINNMLGEKIKNKSI